MNLKEKIREAKEEIKNLSDKFNANETTLSNIRNDQNEILKAIERLSGKVDAYTELDTEVNKPGSPNK